MNENEEQKLMKPTTIAAALMALAISAHAAPMGTIIVYRRWSIVGSAGSFKFNVDHGADNKISNGRYMKFVVPAGDHVISHDHIFMTPQDPQTVHVESGKTIYFKYVAKPWSLFFEVSDDQEEAAQAVATMKEETE